MKQVLVIGGATLDNIIAYEDMETMVHQSSTGEHAYLLLEEGKKIEVTEQQSFSGGGATNTAVSFAKQAYDVTLFCKIGRDMQGEMIVKELEGHHIDTQHIRYCDELGTATSFVVPSLRGDRTVFAYRGANTTLTAQELPYELLQQVDFAYITSLSRHAAEALPDIVKQAAEAKVHVAVNPGTSQLGASGSQSLYEALKGIHTFIVNYEEAMQFMLSLMHNDQRLLSNVSHDERKKLKDKLLDSKTVIQDVSFSLRQFFDAMIQAGPEIVVVTDGHKGVYVGTKEKLYYHPGLQVEVVNTLGAGDAFGSSFVGALQQGASVEDAIRAGVVNSASVVQHPDAKTGLYAQDDLQKAIAAIDQTLLVAKPW